MRVHAPLLGMLLLALPVLASAAEITVAAAASLTRPFEDIIKQYERTYPDAKINMVYGTSGGLVEQLGKGAKFDVIATADQHSMNIAQKKGLVVPACRGNFLRNALVVVVPTNAKRIPRTLADLGQGDFQRIAIGEAANVSVGRYAIFGLVEAQQWNAVKPYAQWATSNDDVIRLVREQKVDAAFTYVTSAMTYPKDMKVAFRVSLKNPVRYPIATTATARNVGETGRFITYMHSSTARRIFQYYGFLTDF